MSETQSINRAASLLKLSATLIFLGHAYGYYFFGSPLRVLLWDQGLLEPLVNGLGGEWSDYVGNPENSLRIRYLTGFIAFVWLVAGLAVWGKQDWLRSLRRLLIWFGTGFLLLHTLLDWKDQWYRLAQLLEHAIQVATPLLVLYVGKRGLVTSQPGTRVSNDLIPHLVGNPARLLLYCKIAIALTFASHGLFALGFYPIPGKFIDMVISITGLGEGAVRNLLLIAGVLDLVIAVGVFLPRRLARPVLYYAAFWGLATALARLLAGFQWGDPLLSLHNYGYQVLYRLPHGLLPVVGLLLISYLGSAGVKPTSSSLA